MDHSRNDYPIITRQLAPTVWAKELLPNSFTEQRVGRFDHPLDDASNQCPRGSKRPRNSFWSNDYEQPVPSYCPRVPFLVSRKRRYVQTTEVTSHYTESPSLKQTAWSYQSPGETIYTRIQLSISVKLHTSARAICLPTTHRQN